MTYALAIDPGVSNGVVLFSWNERQAYHRDRAWQFKGGAEGLADWMDDAQVRYSPARKTWMFGTTPLQALVMEKFTPQENAGHALTEDSVEPLRCEGVVISAGHHRDTVTWQRPAAQYFMGNGPIATLKKASREFLKTNGLYLTGSMVSQPDADDAISATLHSIAYMRKIRHAPTLAAMFS